MSDKIKYDINKLVNRPFEYKGFKGAYVYKTLGLLASTLFLLLISFMVFTTPLKRLIAAGVIILIHLIFIIKNKYKSDKYNDLQRNRAKRLTPKRISYRSRNMFYKKEPTKYD